jgi:hypothetical protein
MQLGQLQRSAINTFFGRFLFPFLVCVTMQGASANSPVQIDSSALKAIQIVGHRAGVATNRYLPHQNSVLALGRGFDPSDPTVPKKACITFSAKPLDSGPPETRMSLIYVTNTEQLDTAIDVDSKIDASLLANRVSAHVHQHTTDMRRATSITVVLKAYTYFGRWALDVNAGLTGDAKNYLQTGDFAEKCGTDYVSIERRGSSVSAIITLYSVTTDFKNTFDSDMTVSGGYGPLNAKATNDFKAELKRETASNRVGVDVTAAGGEGFGDLSEIVKTALSSNNGVDAAADALQNFIAKFNKENPTAIEYVTSSMEDFGWSAGSLEPWTDPKQTRLQELAEIYRSTSDDLAEVKEVVAKTHPLSSVLEPSFAGDLAPTIAPAERYLAEVARVHGACKANKASDLSDCEIPARTFSFAFSFEPLLGLIRRAMDPPRVVMLSSLPPMETQVVLSAPPVSRLSIAREFDRSIDGLGVTYQVNGSYLLSGKIVFVEDTKVETGVTLEGNIHNVGFVWWHSEPNPYPDCLETLLGHWMAGFSGSHSGTFYEVVKDKVGRSFRLAIMNVSWKAEHGGLLYKDYELVY